MKSIRLLVPDNDEASPETLYLSRKLLAAYLLCQVNTVNYPYSAIDRYFGGCVALSDGIDDFLKKSLEVRFCWPENAQKGAFYLVFNEESKEMSYAVIHGTEQHAGEIIDEEYKSLKKRLRRRGTLSLKEVNFLIEHVVIPRHHLPYFSEVHDPLALGYLYDFLESDRQVQQEALRLVSHLKPFDEFGFEPPTALVLEPLDYPDLSPSVNMLDAIIHRYRTAGDKTIIGNSITV